jgi:opacity protein-like surface antigen
VAATSQGPDKEPLYKESLGAGISVALLAAVLSIVVFLGASPAQAAILPEDRADVMYHGYDGGGLKVNGPSVLVRKAYKETVSMWANYYVDMITSASIDVLATASEYDEERKEKSIGVDYLHGKTFMGLSYTNSEESDYSANSVRFGISQDFFGDLSTLGISYSRGWDEVRRNGDESFAAQTDRQGYRIDFSQILTKNLILGMNYEAVTDEGDSLNNPYRQVRYLDSNAARGYSYESEIYPRTKTSSAFAMRAMYYLPYRAALKAEGRIYSDTWGTDAWNAELAYTHPLPKGLTMEVKYRYYQQTAADFYSDLFPRQQAQNFMARDKELASYSTHTIGAGVTYEFPVGWMPFFKKGEINLFVDYLLFQYDDFRDVTVTGVAAGEEPLYDFHSFVTRAFISFWY